MSLSRWKMMAGVLGVSIGGLAAAASQCPKWDSSKGRTPDMPVSKAEPKVAPAGAPSAPTPPATLEFPALPGVPAVPAAPQLVPAGPTPPTVEAPKPTVNNTLPALPDLAPDVKLAKPDTVTPTAGVTLPLPSLPATPAKPTDSPKPAAPPLPTPVVDLTPVPTKPAALPAPVPTPGDLIPSAPSVPPMKPATPPMPPATAAEVPAFNPAPPKPTPIMSPPVVGASGTQPVTPSAPALTPEVPVGIDVPVGKPATPAPAPAAPAVVAAAATDVKFRILLRVGEGEPMFEVKNGDNLVLKVACDKVDIKSPEKGSGLSEVTARGKVRFAGFGAEGTCDELKFFAGTGEVSMTGDVKLQVKDKLGRVESELTTATMKYKIDASAVGGALKP